MHCGTLKRTSALVITLCGGILIVAADEDTGNDLERAAGYFREVDTLCDADGGQLWGVSLKGPLMFVDPTTRAVYANQADAEGHLKQDGEIFVGTLPANVPIANTALTWAGTEWTQLMWPLPADAVHRRVLLMHESWHRVQDELGLPAASPANAHLNTLDGRFWVQLEWRALERALRTSGAERRAAIEDAVLFRRERHRRVASAAEQECALEFAEGLAEYTGIRLSGMATDEQHAFAARQSVERAVQRMVARRRLLPGRMMAMSASVANAVW